MKIDKEFPERVSYVTEKDCYNFYFLKVDIYLIMHDPYLKLYKCIQNIAVTGTVSQILDIRPCSFSIKYRK